MIEKFTGAILAKRSFNSKQGVGLAELTVLSLDEETVDMVIIEQEALAAMGDPMPDPRVAFEIAIEGQGSKFSRPRIIAIKKFGVITWTVESQG